jgi:divalent metal cation (Fe/Co/Zn/Cd) transporter
MPAEAASDNSLETRILSLQTITLVWMILECSVALFAAWRARSVSLLAFGSDSFVELLSATIVLMQFSPRLHISQYRAARLCGSLLYGLAAIVAAIAVTGLLRHTEADTSVLGIAITAGALLVMPLLAQRKHEAAAQTGNQALRATQCNPRRVPTLLDSHWRA